MKLRSKSESMTHDIDPDVVRDALREFLQELKDNEREKDLAKIEVDNLNKQVSLVW